MAHSLTVLLEQLGWSEGFHIPFASEENKLLEMKLEALINKKQELATLYQDMSDNINSLKQFQKNINERRIENQNILMAYRNQLENEEKVYTDVHFEREKKMAHLKDIRKEYQKLMEINKFLKLELEKSTSKINKKQKNVEWGKELQEFWASCIASQWDDISLIEKYKLREDRRFEQLELRRTKLSSEIEKYERTLKEKLCKKSSLECELQQTKKIFRKMRKERKQLIDQWESALCVLKARDGDIEQKSWKINVIQEVIRNKRGIISQKSSFYKEQVRDNMQLELMIKDITRTLSIRQLENNKLSKQLDDSNNLLIESRREMVNLQSELSHEREAVKLILKEVVEKREFKEMLANNKKELQKKFKNLQGQYIPTNGRINELEDILQEKEKIATSLEKDVKTTQTSTQKITNKINEIGEKILSTEAEIKCRTKAKIILNNEMSTVKNEISCQQEMCNKIETRIKEVNIKISQQKGMEPDENKNKLELKLKERIKDLQEKQKEHDTITAQVKNIDTEIKLLNTHLNKGSEKMRKMENSEAELSLTIEGAEKQLEQLTGSNQEKQVEENVLRVRVHQLEKMLAKETRTLHDVERQKIELEQAVKERKLEIGSTKNVLILRKRTLLQEHSDLKKNIECITLRINQLMKRYEIIIESLGRDEEGNPISIKNYKIEMVKKRAQLLEKGDDLDVNIRKVEKDIQAMENTRQLVNLSNEHYKEQHSNGSDITVKEYQELDNLENEYNNLTGVLKQKKESLKNIENYHQDFSQTHMELKTEIKKLEQIKEDKLTQSGMLNRYLNDQEKKIKNVDNQIKCYVKCTKNWKTKFSPKSIIRDIEIRLLQELNKKALQQLSELVAGHIEVGPVVKQYLSEKNISFPASIYRIRQNYSHSPYSQSSRISLSDDASCTSNDSVMTMANVINIDSSVLDEHPLSLDSRMKQNKQK